MLNTYFNRSNICSMKRLLLETKTFYGTKRRKFENVENKSNYIRDNPIAELHTSSSLLGGSRVWEVFQRQSEALQRCRGERTDLMVFSREIVGGGGGRNFVVTSASLFWRTMMQLPPGKRCSYEVIAVDAPCKLYFDLEFARATNPQRDGVALTDAFIRIVNYYIGQAFAVLCSHADVLNLDSCSEVKFSKHLIYNEKIVFENNIYAGNFVKHVCAQIEQLAEQNAGLPACQLNHSDIENMMVRDGGGKRAIFCDTAVYTKNRNFRLFKCTKFGKKAALEVAVDNKSVPAALTGESTFFASLITHVTKRPDMLLQFGSIDTPPTTTGKTIRSTSNSYLSTCKYAKIDRFIESVIGCGSIRKCSFFDEPSILVYDIANYRYCHNIHREHKSNGIMYVVSLQTGVYYQKCYDPDCRGFKSNEIPLPFDTEWWKLTEKPIDEIPSTPNEKNS